VIGNLLEWYDFAIYGYFAVSIGRTFFPREDAVAQVLAAFSIFAVGYVMRPLGGVVVGQIGDRLGRKTALTFSVAAMAVPTFLVGILPGYQTLGVAAPILLTLLRMIQGLAVGGEYTTATVFLVERAPPGRRGLMGAISGVGSAGGILLGSATGAAFTALLPADILASWGWRIPFVLGLVVGTAGFFLRHSIEEMPVGTGKHERLDLALRPHLPSLARMAGLSVFDGVSFYLMFLYVVSWLQLVDGIAPQHALEINTASMTALIPVVIFGGWLSDRIGRKKVMLIALVGGLLAAFPLLWLMHHRDPVMILSGQLGFVLISGLYGGALSSALVETLPVSMRCSGVALGYNIPVGIVGGLTPLAATWLVNRTGDDFSPAYMMMAAAAVSLCALLFHRETFKSAFQTAGQTTGESH
jgi:MHS family proline/betaine transporter-like MFS transporter